MSFGNPPNYGAGGALPKPSQQEKAVRFHEDLQYNWRKNFKTIPIKAPNTGVPFNKDWTQRQNQATKNMVKQYEDEGKEHLQRIYPYTHVLPQEERYRIQRDMMKGQTAYAYAPDGSDKIMGKAFVGPEYFAYKQQELNRAQALAFDQYIMNNMDISTLEKKAYWKQRMPEYYQKIIDGGMRNLQKEFRKGTILLKGPQSLDDWKFLYEHVVIPEYGAVISTPYNTPIPPLPGYMSRESTERDGVPGPQNNLYIAEGAGEDMRDEGIEEGEENTPIFNNNGQQ